MSARPLHQKLNQIQELEGQRRVLNLLRARRFHNAYGALVFRFALQVFGISRCFGNGILLSFCLTLMLATTCTGDNFKGRVWCRPKLLGNPTHVEGIP